MATGSEAQLRRVRRLCLALPGASERLSHGEPTFFVHKQVFVMFANGHHGDGRVAVWVPAPPGAQAARIAEDTQTYFRPPYVGHRGWLGIVLERVSDDELGAHLSLAWELTAPKRLLKSAPPRPRG